MATDMSIGDNLARIRMRRGLTQEQLAERSGVSVATIRKLERNDRTSARVATLRQLAVALRVNTSDLFGITASKSSSAEFEQMELMPLRRVLTPGRCIGGGIFADDDEGAPDLVRLRNSVDEANRLYHADRYSAALRVVPAVIREARVAADNLAGAAGQAALALLGQALQLAGSLLVQIRQYDLAYQALGGAVDASERAGRQQAAASGVVSLCWLFLRQGRIDEAERLAVATASRVEPKMSKASTSDLAAWGWLLLRGSAAAVRNNRIDDAEDLLKQAQAAAVRIGRDLIDYGEYWTSFGPSTVAMKAVENAMVAGRYGAALHLATLVPADGRPTSNNRNRFLLDVASANVAERRYADALGVLVDIWHRAPEWLRHQNYAKDIVARLVRSRSRALPGQLRELADFLDVGEPARPAN